MELEQEISERVKLFRTLVGSSECTHEKTNVVDVLEDLRLQVFEYKAQRDSLAAEIKLVEEAISDFELFVNGERSKINVKENSESYLSPSARLRACLRKV